MESIEFIAKYPSYLELIKKFTKEKYQPILIKMEG